MATENRISIQIPPADLQIVRDALKLIRKTLERYLISLTPEQRKRLAKMSDGTEPFVSKVLDFSESDTEFNPPFMDVAELRKDLEVYTQLYPLYIASKQLANELSDTSMLAGSEAYVASLSYYNSVKMGAKMNVNGAKAIYDTLSKRFEKSSSSSEEPK